MQTPSEFQCRLIRRALTRYAADLTAEAKKVKALGFDGEAFNLEAASVTLKEHILPQFGDAEAARGGTQLDLEDQIRLEEWEQERQEEPPVTCLQCAGVVPEAVGGDFCSDICRRQYEMGVDADGVVTGEPLNVDLTGFDDDVGQA